ncbi:hypothetical protein Tsubulata_039668 [Turnera subulata]|uniref:Uncharacterized protein n=1 Tax=Turnera subulata TaxID=218843 RepID=A0A9Q0FID5_9ROSI|nr:hypothetical protein Tsubulata_039668 [Turnera subulata]
MCSGLSDIRDLEMSFLAAVKDGEVNASLLLILFVERLLMIPGRFFSCVLTDMKHVGIFCASSTQSCVQSLERKIFFQIAGNILLFMDIRVPSEEVSQEKARELLIAISYSEPDKLIKPDAVTATANCANGVLAVNGDGDEKHRSELISISYTESPDTKMSAATFGNHEA